MGDRKTTGTYKPFAKLEQFMKQIVWKADSPLESSTLHHLASNGNEAELLELINAGSDVNEEDDDGYTALHHAADNGHAQIIEILLQNGAYVNQTGKCSPLHVVQDLKSAQILLQAEANLNAKDELGNSPLQTAMRKGKQDIVEYFLSIGADIFCPNAKGETPLHTLYSSFMKMPNGAEDLTTTLIDMGVKVNSRDSQGRTPLHWAVMNYSLEKSKAVDILIRAGASVTDVDLLGMNPIHLFIDKCRPYLKDYDQCFLENIDLLVTDHGAANSRNAIGQTILHLATSLEAPVHVLEYLAQKGCSLTTQDGQKRSLLHCIVERDVDDGVDTLDFLLDKGLNINCPDIWGQTVLHLAAEKNRKTLVKSLVERGADMSVRDTVGRQPLHLAAANECDVICDFLITEGANINAQDKYQSTPLHFAAWSNKASTAHVLIKAGCDVELRDACGQTAEEVAKFWSSFDFLQIMYERDANNNFELEQRKKSLTKHGGELLKLKTFQDIIDSSEQSLRTSGTLEEFLRRLLSTPGIGTVFADPEAVEIREAVDRFATNVVKRIADIHPKMRCSLYKAGSSSEGTKTKYPDEFDYVVCLDELSENIYPEHETEDVLKSVHYVPGRETNEQVKEVLEDGVDYEETLTSVSSYTRILLKDHPSYDYSEFTLLEPKAISNYMFNLFAQQLSNIIFEEHFPKDERLEIKGVTNDPKLSLLWKGSRYKALKIDVDFVPAVRLPSWPDKFQIDSQLLGPDLSDLPCLAVPKMTSQQDANLWRCSLCLVETAIMKRCLQRIRNSYIAAKSLVDSASICPHVSFEEYEEFKLYYRNLHDSVSSDEEFELHEQIEALLPSYILKMAFFHSIQEKARKDGVDNVFDEGHQWVQLCAHQSERDSGNAMRNDPDPNIVKDIFMTCEAWLSNHFVPSFFNPQQNVMGSNMMEENSAKALIFVKYILKLLNEKC